MVDLGGLFVHPKKHLRSVWCSLGILVVGAGDKLPFDVQLPLSRNICHYGFHYRLQLQSNMVYNPPKWK